MRATKGVGVITVSELGEFGLIKRVTAAVSAGAASAATTLVGPGDEHDRDRDGGRDQRRAAGGGIDRRSCSSG